MGILPTKIKKNNYTAAFNRKQTLRKYVKCPVYNPKIIYKQPVKVINYQRKGKSTGTKVKMIQMLELSDKSFKAVMTMLHFTL